MAVAARARRAHARGPETRVIELAIDDISVEGDGVGRANGQVIHVPYTIPGERVRVRVPQTTRAPVVATLLDVLHPSPHRVAPRCPHHGRQRDERSPDTQSEMSVEANSTAPACGGCRWQHIAYAEQLRLKSALVERLIRARLPHAPAVTPMRTAHRESPWGYRQRAHFVVGTARTGRRRRDVVLGHYARFSRRLVPVDTCPVHDPRAETLARSMRTVLSHAGVDAGSRAALQSLAVRSAWGTDERMVTLVVADDRDSRLRAATRQAVAATPGTSFHVNVHDEGGSLIFGARTRTIAGSERLREEVLGTSYLMSPTSFFQTNVAAAEVLVQLVLEAAPSAPARIADLYAGAGLFAIPLARAGHVVTAVEANRAAVADGRASARLNRLSEAQCRFVAASTEQALASLGPIDLVVLDPPREGCDTAVIARLFGRLRPPTVVYVSCNPEALSVDLQAASRHGYETRRITPVDMFPHTAHIETVVVLTR